MKKALTMLGAGLLMAALGGPVAAEDERWIHVRVDEKGADAARVDLQIPLAMVSAILPALSAHVGGDGRIDLGSHGMELAEVRTYWNAVKGSKDGNYITVRDDEDDVRVAKRGGLLHVDVDEKGGAARVRLRVPVTLVDAVLGTKDTLDFDALAKALGGAPSGDMVSVDDDDSRVRIWIDDRPAAAREDTP